MHRKPASNLLPWLLCVALAVFLAPAAFAEEEKKEEKKAAEEAAEPAKSEAESPAAAADAKKDCAEVEVFTNEDLERLFGRGEETTPETGPEEGEPADGTARPEPRPVEPVQGAGTAQPADPLQWMEERKTRQAERQEQIAAAEAAIGAARERIADLEQRIRATKNPYLARPQIPDDEKSDWDGMSAPERVAAAEQQLQEAREELRKAEEELARLRSQP